MKLTREELEALPEKAKKDPAVVQLYLEHDYLTAYAKHTDLRVSEDGYRSAVGAAHDWERHGELQFQFLKQQGLKPEYKLLEIGCGTGRLARKAVPYLAPCGYVGVDISRGALDAARNLAREEGWINQAPLFVDSTVVLPSGRFDFIWSFSVFIHLPADVMRHVMQEAHRVLASTGKFLFSYVPEQIGARTGLKQFRHTLQTYKRAARSAGLTFESVMDWGGEQRVALSRKR